MGLPGFGTLALLASCLEIGSCVRTQGTDDLLGAADSAASRGLEAARGEFLQSHNRTSLGISAGLRGAGPCREQLEKEFDHAPFRWCMLFPDLQGDCLGQGTFGQTWKACSKYCPNTCFAMKIVRPLANQAWSSYLSASIREQAFMNFVGAHPQFVTQYSAYDDLEMKASYFLMGLTDGGDVEGAIGKLNAVDMATLMTDILEGVIIMHHNGMVHSDLKPENVLITPQCGGSPLAQCHAKIADFGLSCMMYANLGMPPNGVDRGYCSQCGQQGTPYYFSPEMLTTHQQPAPPFDVWAVGMIAYVLIFNGLPDSYQVGTRDALFNAILSFKIDEDPKFRDRYQAYPQSPDGVFLRHALDPEPSTRYTAQQLQPLMAQWAQSWGARGAGAASEPRPSEQCFLNEHCKGSRVNKLDLLDLFAARERGII